MCPLRLGLVQSGLAAIRTSICLQVAADVEVERVGHLTSKSNLSGVSGKRS